MYCQVINTNCERKKQKEKEQENDNNKDIFLAKVFTIQFIVFIPFPLFATPFIYTDCLRTDLQIHMSIFISSFLAKKSHTTFSAEKGS